MWLTEKEAQKYLKVSRSTLLRLEETGKLPVYRVGGERLRRYRQEDLDAVMEPEIPKAAQGQSRDVLREPWQRFTRRARRTILLAHNMALASQGETVDTEHLLAGLVHVSLLTGQTLAARVLLDKGISVADLNSELEDQMEPRKGKKNNRPLVFSADGKEAVRRAIREADELHSWRINSGHLLLGLLDVGQGLAYELLHAHGVKLEEVRLSVQDLPGTE